MVWTNPPIRLFHGTLDVHVASILDSINWLGENTKTDFGRGFYTTTSIFQAIDWAEKLAVRRARRFPGATAAVIGFAVDRLVLAELEGMAFVRGDMDATDFWTLVDHCRIGNSHIGDDDWYDLVSGPVAQFPYEDHLAFPDYDQFSFHTEAAVAILNTSTKWREI